MGLEQYQGCYNSRNVYDIVLSIKIINKRLFVKLFTEHIQQKHPVFASLDASEKYVLKKHFIF